MEQIWVAGDENSESCEEYSYSKGSDAEYDAVSSEDLLSYMDEAVLSLEEGIAMDIQHSYTV